LIDFESFVIEEADESSEKMTDERTVGVFLIDEVIDEIESGFEIERFSVSEVSFFHS